LPGFIDLQVNGGGGVLFNDQPTVAGIAAIAEAHRRFGTTGLLPTLISDELGAIARAIAAVDAAIEAGVPGVIGIHIEGPFLNPARKGIHDPSKFASSTMKRSNSCRRRAGSHPRHAGARAGSAGRDPGARRARRGGRGRP
jgi:N-acetylglucosamine-6-phosphate deacetylase